MPTNDDSSGAMSESAALHERIRDLEQEVERWRTRAEHTERILEVSPGYTFVFDTVERRSIYSSGALAKILGYEAEDLVRMGPDFMPAVVHPDDLPRAAEVEAELAGQEDGSVVVFEHRLRHRSGEWRWVEARCGPGSGPRARPGRRDLPRGGGGPPAGGRPPHLLPRGLPDPR